MPDRDTLINTLMLCLGEGNENPDPCNYCAYSAKGACVREMMRDALALLREQDKTANDRPFQRHDCGALIVYRGRDVCPYCGRKVKWDA